MNVLIIGNNPKIAKQFSLFSEVVFMVVPSISDSSNRRSSEMNDYCLVYSNNNPSNFFGFFRRKKEIHSLVTNNKIDIIFSNRKDDMVAAKLATRSMKQKPILLVTFHNSLSWLNAKKVKLLSYLIDKNADGCICLAHLAFDQLQENKLKHTKLIYLPNTIQFENILRKQKYELNDNKLKLCYVGVIVPNKNQLFLVQVINELKNHIDVTLDLYGDFLDNNYAETIKKYIAENNLQNYVHLMGNTNYEFIKSHLGDYDAYFSATAIEMSPYNILEAKAAGLPIVASNVHGQKDLITDGYDGILYSFNSIIDAKQQIFSIFYDADFRKKIGTNAYIDVSETNSYKVASVKLHRFIELLK